MAKERQVTISRTLEAEAVGQLKLEDAYEKFMDVKGSGKSARGKI